MDEDLFRNYFIKLYKSLAIMENEYLKCLKNEEKRGFTIFTKSMKDLATHFRCVKEHKQPNMQEDDTYAPRPSNKIITEVATKMIYGVGEL